MQLVQQVRQALRMGMLTPGDQLPKVREVAEALVINPNTVLKAYRELELEGLVEGRRGQGTFILRSLAGPAVANLAVLRTELVAWLGRARTAGLDRDEIDALVQTTLRRSFSEGIA
jgi:GntR family transcriptional regulator